MDNSKKADIFLWLSGLPNDDPRLDQIDAIRRDAEPTANNEPYLTLKEVARTLGFADHTSLHRLKVQRVGEQRTPGGRFKYKLSKVRAYLKGPQAAEAREALRRERRKRDRS